MVSRTTRQSYGKEVLGELRNHSQICGGLRLGNMRQMANGVQSLNGRRAFSVVSVLAVHRAAEHGSPQPERLCKDAAKFGAWFGRTRAFGLLSGPDTCAASR